MSNKMKALLYPVDSFSYISEESSFTSPISSLKSKILHSLRKNLNDHMFPFKYKDLNCFHLAFHPGLQPSVS